MYKTISNSDFHDAFTNSGRENQFSYEAKNALFNYLEELEEDSGRGEELDVIALCCSFSEYETAEEAASDYFDFEGMTFDDDGDELETPEEVEQKALDFLRDRAQVLVFDGGVIVSQ